MCKQMSNIYGDILKISFNTFQNADIFTKKNNSSIFKP